MRAGLRSAYTSYLVVAVALAFVAAGPAPIQALTPGAASATNRADHSLRLRLAPGADGMTRTAQAVSRDLMAYSFRVEGAASEKWTVTLTLRGDFPVMALQLRSDAPEITLPRPLGLSLRAADTLFVLATFEGQDSAAVTLVILYEPVDDAAGRLPVHPVRAKTHAVRGDLACTWHFTAKVSGRVLALTGFPMKRVRAMALVDAISGVTLWSTSVDQSATAAYRASMPRLGAVIEAGRPYRLQVEFMEAADKAGAASVVAMVLPIRQNASLSQ